VTNVPAYFNRVLITTVKSLLHRPSVLKKTVFLTKYARAFVPAKNVQFMFKVNTLRQTFWLRPYPQILNKVETAFKGTNALAYFARRKSFMALSAA